MLNQDKIRIMSRCAMYEKAKGKEDLRIHHYFQGDYIRLNTIKALIGVTIGFVICLGLYMALNVGHYMEKILNMNLMSFGKEVLIIYAAVMIVFAVISVLFYGWKYADARKRVNRYYEDIQKLKEMNDEMGDKE